MQKKIIISGREINYQIRKYKLSKNLKLSIRPCFEDEIGCEKNSRLKILVAIPSRVSLVAVEKFIQEKSDWIVDKLDELKIISPEPKIIWDKKTRTRERKKAKKIIIEKVTYFGNLYGFQFKRIVIRAQRTRWGSCSKDGNLNFNYKMIYLPEKIMDYIIVHELCHLDQFNHSKRFWFLVSEIIPDYRELRKKLKKINI
ncbi:MAG: YgjP-like metallopeptidase domain-containing protein [Parcubacteria group bacterium]|jgi:hypothetical protein